MIFDALNDSNLSKLARRNLNIEYEKLSRSERRVVRGFEHESVQYFYVWRAEDRAN